MKIERHNMNPLQKNSSGFWKRLPIFYWKPWKPINRTITYWGYWKITIGQERFRSRPYQLDQLHQEQIDKITEHVRAATNKFVNQKMSPQIMSATIDTVKKVLEKQVPTNDINKHLSISVKQDEFEPTKINIVIRPLDEVGIDFLKYTWEAK